HSALRLSFVNAFSAPMSASVVSSSRRRPVRWTTCSMDEKRPIGCSGTVHSCAHVLQKYVPSLTTSIIDSSSDPHFGHSGRLKPAPTFCPPLGTLAPPPPTPL